MRQTKFIYPYFKYNILQYQINHTEEFNIWHSQTEIDLNKLK